MPFQSHPEDALFEKIAADIGSKEPENVGPAYLTAVAQWRLTKAIEELTLTLWKK